MNLEWTFVLFTHFGVTTGITQGFRVIPEVTPKWVNNTDVHSKFTLISLFSKIHSLKSEHIHSFLFIEYLTNCKFSLLQLVTIYYVTLVIINSTFCIMRRLMRCHRFGVGDPFIWSVEHRKFWATPSAYCPPPPRHSCLMRLCEESRCSIIPFINADRMAVSMSASFSDSTLKMVICDGIKRRRKKNTQRNAWTTSIRNKLILRSMALWASLFNGHAYLSHNTCLSILMTSGKHYNESISIFFSLCIIIYIHFLFAIV